MHKIEITNNNTKHMNIIPYTVHKYYIYNMHINTYN